MAADCDVALHREHSMNRLFILITLAGCNADGLGGDAVKADLASTMSFPPAPDLLATCADGVRDQDESDVDCGGALCAACSSGKSCATDGDCVSGLCLMGACVDGPTCTDGRKDGRESDVDCGGPDCAGCALNRSCGKDGDCAS